MQTISVPFSCSPEGLALLKDCRRIYSAAVRTAYANAVAEDGKPVKQKDLRDLVKRRFAGGVVSETTVFQELQLSDLIGDKPLEPLINGAGQVSSPTRNAVSEVTSMRKAQATSVSQTTSRSRCHLVQRTCLLQQTRQGFHLAVNCSKSEYRARLGAKGVLRTTRWRSEINLATHSMPRCMHLAVSGGRQWR